VQFFKNVYFACTFREKCTFFQLVIQFKDLSTRILNLSRLRSGNVLILRMDYIGDVIDGKNQIYPLILLEHFVNQGFLHFPSV